LILGYIYISYHCLILFILGLPASALVVVNGEVQFRHFPNCFIELAFSLAFELAGMAFILILIFITVAPRTIDANTQFQYHGGSVAKKVLPDVNSTNAMLLVNITVLNNAVFKGAVCLDGSPPAYHLHRGFGSGANRWLVHMEGGGWCYDMLSCSGRAASPLGSSLYMGDTIAFTGILSDVRSQNPDFYSWNRVMVRYCDGSSFTGDVEEVDPINKVHFRGQRIWQAVMEDLLAKGMYKARQALLTGCSAGGVTTFIHCDRFNDLLPGNAKVKCMPDAGFFIDSNDISGGNQQRFLVDQMVTLHGSSKHLPVACTAEMIPSSLCFFPQYLLQWIRTPLLVVNSAYDPLQIRFILVPAAADPNNYWRNCKMNITRCAPWQLRVMEEFTDYMINALTPVSNSRTGGLFINSCYAHCQTNVQALWHSPSSPRLYSKTIAEAAGDWYFGRSVVKYIDCPYPCDSTCNNSF